MSQEFGGDGLPNIGEQPITPKESLLISYTSTPDSWETLGFVGGVRIPGFISKSSFVALLSILPDGMRPGEFMISTIFPKDKDSGNYLLMSDVVFDTPRFGPQSVNSFVQRFPDIPLGIFFSECILTDSTDMLIKSRFGKNHKKQMKMASHTEVLNSTSICTVCNTV
jgi:hypothetical protein